MTIVGFFFSSDYVDCCSVDGFFSVFKGGAGLSSLTSLSLP